MNQYYSNSTNGGFNPYAETLGNIMFNIFNSEVPPPPFMHNNPFGQAPVQDPDIPPGTIDLTFEEITDQNNSQN